MVKKILNAVKFQEKKKDGRKDERNFKNKSIEIMGLLETEIADVFCFVDFLNIVLFVFYLIALLGQFLAFKVA